MLGILSFQNTIRILRVDIMFKKKESFRTTTDHQEIRRWAEEHGGSPAQMKGSSGGEDENAPGSLRLHFPHSPTNESLEDLTWEQFFDKFDRGGFELEYVEVNGADYSDTVSYRIKPRNSPVPHAHQPA